MFRFRVLQGGGYGSDIVGVTILGGDAPGDRDTMGPAIADDPLGRDGEGVRFFGASLQDQSSHIRSEFSTRERGMLDRMVSEARNSNPLTGTTPETWSPLAPFRREHLAELQKNLETTFADTSDRSRLWVDASDHPAVISSAS